MAEWIIEANDTEEAAEGKFAFIREVVRCKDCDNWIQQVDKTYGWCSEWSAPEMGYGRFTDEDDYCSHGERREDDAEQSESDT